MATHSELFDWQGKYLHIYIDIYLLAGQINANMQHNRANGDTSTKIGVMTPEGILNRSVRPAT